MAGEILNPDVDENTCSHCGERSRELLRCARCQTAQYCNQQHQRLHWKSGHKSQCYAPDATPPPISADDMDANTLAKAISHCLRAHGYAVVDGFLGSSMSLSARSDVISLKRNGLLQPGELAGGRTGNSLKFHVKNVRGDEILWVDPDSDTETAPGVSSIVEKFDEMANRLNDTMPTLKLTGRTKAMVTCYPGNSSRYVKHADNPDNDGRKLTMVYYLNDEWDASSDGGVLRLFNPSSSKPSSAAEANCPDARTVDVEPSRDRIVLFWSDKRIIHEVLPTHKERFAMTCWYFGGERAEARASQSEDAENAEHLIERKKLWDEKNAEVEALRQKIAKLKAERDELQGTISEKEKAKEAVIKADGEMPANDRLSFAAGLGLVLSAMEITDPEKRADAFQKCASFLQESSMQWLKISQPTAFNLIETTMKMLAAGGFSSGERMVEYLKLMLERVENILGPDDPVVKRLRGHLAEASGRTLDDSQPSDRKPMFEGVTEQDRSIFTSILLDMTKIVSLSDKDKRKKGYLNFNNMMSNANGQCGPFLDRCPGLAFIVMRTFTLLQSWEKATEMEHQKARINELHDLLNQVGQAHNASGAVLEAAQKFKTALECLSK